VSNLTQKQRDALPDSAFCGPNRTFPIIDRQDVESASHLYGRADNPEAVKACVIAKAKARGWPIPATWQE